MPATRKVKPAAAKKVTKKAPAKMSAAKDKELETASQIAALQASMAAQQASMAAILDRLPPAQAFTSAVTTLAGPESSATPRVKRKRGNALREAEETRVALQASLLDLQPLSDDSEEDDDDVEEEDAPTPPPLKRGKCLTSGRVRTADSARNKLHQLWPHEQGIYDDAGVPLTYDKLTMSQFVQGYILNIKKSPQSEKADRLDFLQALMQDADRFPWDLVRNFYAIFLQQVEQGNMTWGSSSEQIRELRMRHLYLTPAPATQRPTPPRGAAAKQRKGNTSVVACCPAYNTAKGCHKTPGHDGLRHACSHCYKHLKRHFVHSKAECRKLAPVGDAK